MPNAHEMLCDQIGRGADSHTGKEGGAQQQGDGEAPRTIVHAHTSVQPPVVTGLLRLLTGEAPFASLDWILKQSNDQDQSHVHLPTSDRFWLILINAPAGAHAQMSREAVSAAARTTLYEQRIWHLLTR